MIYEKTLQVFLYGFHVDSEIKYVSISEVPDIDESTRIMHPYSRMICIKVNVNNFEENSLRYKRIKYGNKHQLRRALEKQLRKDL